MNTVIDLICLVLAADAIVTAWFYGSIFENTRENIEARGGLIGELVGCPLCFSYHICFWLVVLLWLPAQLLPESVAIIPRVVLYSFAATDLVHWLQGVRPIPEEEDDNMSL